MNQDLDNGKGKASRNAQDPRARRRLVKTLAASGGMVVVGKVVTDWNKPVIESVLLPAHAQTTGVYQLGCRVLYTFENADATANSGETVELGEISAGFGDSVELFQINQVEANLLLNGTPVPNADICISISITETTDLADVDVDEAPFAGGATHSVQTAASGTATVGGPFPVDEDALSAEEFNVRVQFWECDNPDVPACMINFSGSTND